MKLGEHKRFRGGLDCSGRDTTGTHSVFTSLFVDTVTGALLKDDALDTAVPLEVMFHVSTMLQHSSNPQQLDRKRHLGNDIVILVFNESEKPFDPSTFASQFNHVWIVVTPRKLWKGIPEEYQISVIVKSVVRVRWCVPLTMSFRVCAWEAGFTTYADGCACSRACTRSGPSCLLARRC